MSQIDIKDLFDESRFPSGWKLVSLLLYAPLGLILVVIRLLISFQIWILASILPDCQPLRKFLHNGLSLSFGIIVKFTADSEERDPETRILVANQISTMDHFVIRRVAQTVTPSVWELPSSLSEALGVQKMDMSSKDVLVANIKQTLATTKSNIALQPEFGATNNRVALLKFNSWPFGIEPSVQPVVIKAKRPEFVDVRLTSVASTIWIDVLWFLFVPYTIFTLKYLKVKRNTDQEILVREIEKEIADNLNLQTSTHTISDKNEYEKRYLREKILNRGAQSRGAQSRGSTSRQVGSVDMLRMAQRVNEVLPMVPRNVVLRDLLKTRNAEITIANLLDGIVTYIPEQSPSNVPESSVSKHQTQSTKGIKMPGTLSFQERKAKMIADAREKYMEKHGLKNC